MCRSPDWSSRRARRSAYWASGIALFASWNLAVAIGAAAGTAVSDTERSACDGGTVEVGVDGVGYLPQRLELTRRSPRCCSL